MLTLYNSCHRSTCRIVDSRRSSTTLCTTSTRQFPSSRRRRRWRPSLRRSWGDARRRDDGRTARHRPPRSPPRRRRRLDRQPTADPRCWLVSWSRWRRKQDYCRARRRRRSDDGVSACSRLTAGEERIVFVVSLNEKWLLYVYVYRCHAVSL